MDMSKPTSYSFIRVEILPHSFNDDYTIAPRAAFGVRVKSGATYADLSSVAIQRYAASNPREGADAEVWKVLGSRFEKLDMAKTVDMDDHKGSVQLILTKPRGHKTTNPRLSQGVDDEDSGVVRSSQPASSQPTAAAQPGPRQSKQRRQSIPPQRRPSTQSYFLTDDEEVVPDSETETMRQSKQKMESRLPSEASRVPGKATAATTVRCSEGPISEVGLSASQPLPATRPMSAFRKARPKSNPVVPPKPSASAVKISPNQQRSNLMNPFERAKAHGANVARLQGATSIGSMATTDAKPHLANKGATPPRQAMKSDPYDVPSDGDDRQASFQPKRIVGPQRKSSSAKSDRSIPQERLELSIPGARPAALTGPRRNGLATDTEHRITASTSFRTVVVPSQDDSADDVETSVTPGRPTRKAYGKRSASHSINGHVQIVRSGSTKNSADASCSAGPPKPAVVIKTSSGSVPVYRKGESPHDRVVDVFSTASPPPPPADPPSLECIDRCVPKRLGEVESTAKSISPHAAIEQVRRMTQARTARRAPDNPIPESFFDEPVHSDEDLGDMIRSDGRPSTRRTKGDSSTSTCTNDKSIRVSQRSRSASSGPRTPGRAPTPTTSFTPINTLRRARAAEVELVAPVKFGLGYPKQVRDAFSDSDDALASSSDVSDADEPTSCKTDGDEQSYSTEVMTALREAAIKLPDGYLEWEKKYETKYDTNGRANYVSVSNGPWEGLIICGPDKGTYIPGCETPSPELISEGRASGKLIAAPINESDSAASSSEYDSSEDEGNSDENSSRASLGPMNRPNSTVTEHRAQTPSPRRPRSVAGSHSNHPPDDLAWSTLHLSSPPSEQSDSVSVMIFNQLTQDSEAPTSGQLPSSANHATLLDERRLVPSEDEIDVISICSSDSVPSNSAVSTPVRKRWPREALLVETQKHQQMSPAKSVQPGNRAGIENGQITGGDEEPILPGPDTPKVAHRPTMDDHDLEVTPRFERAMSQVETPSTKSRSSRKFTAARDVELDDVPRSSPLTNIVVEIPVKPSPKKSKHVAVSMAATETTTMEPTLSLPVRPFHDMAGTQPEGKNNSQDSEAATVAYVLRESPAWLDNITEITPDDAQETPENKRLTWSSKRGDASTGKLLKSALSSANKRNKREVVVDDLGGSKEVKVEDIEDEHDQENEKQNTSPAFSPSISNAKMNKPTPAVGHLASPSLRNSRATTAAAATEEELESPAQRQGRAASTASTKGPTRFSTSVIKPPVIPNYFVDAGPRKQNGKRKSVGQESTASNISAVSSPSPATAHPDSGRTEVPRMPAIADNVPGEGSESQPPRKRHMGEKQTPRFAILPPMETKREPTTSDSHIGTEITLKKNSRKRSRSDTNRLDPTHAPPAPSTIQTLSTAGAGIEDSQGRRKRAKQVKNRRRQSKAFNVTGATGNITQPVAYATGSEQPPVPQQQQRDKRKSRRRRKKSRMQDGSKINAPEVQQPFPQPVPPPTSVSARRPEALAPADVTLQGGQKPSKTTSDHFDPKSVEPAVDAEQPRPSSDGPKPGPLERSLARLSTVRFGHTDRETDKVGDDHGGGKQARRQTSARRNRSMSRHRSLISPPNTSGPPSVGSRA